MPDDLPTERDTLAAILAAVLKIGEELTGKPIKVHVVCDDGWLKTVETDENFGLRWRGRFTAGRPRVCPPLPTTP